MTLQLKKIEKRGGNKKKIKEKMRSQKGSLRTTNLPKEKIKKKKKNALTKRLLADASLTATLELDPFQERFSLFFPRTVRLFYRALRRVGVRVFS